MLGRLARAEEIFDVSEAHLILLIAFRDVSQGA